MLRPDIKEGDEKLAAGKFHEAQESFDQILETNPLSVRALQGKIAALRQRAEYEEAQDWIETAFSRLGDGDKKVVGIWDELGWLYQDQGRHAQAIDAFEQALARGPTDPGGHYGKVSTFRLMRCYDEMLKAAKVALAQLPTKEKATRAAIWNEGAGLTRSRAGMKQPMGPS